MELLGRRLGPTVEEITRRGWWPEALCQMAADFFQFAQWGQLTCSPEYLDEKLRSWLYHEVARNKLPKGVTLNGSPLNLWDCEEEQDQENYNYFSCPICGRKHLVWEEDNFEDYPVCCGVVIQPNGYTPEEMACINWWEVEKGRAELLALRKGY